jgi:hypothetical protein
MEVRLFICAQSAALDARQGTISAFHILESVNTPAFPVAVPQMSILGIFERETPSAEDPQAQLRVSLGAKELYLGPFFIKFQNRLRARAIVELQGIVLPAPGRLTISLLLEQRETANWVIDINHIGKPNINAQFPLPLPAPTRVTLATGSNTPTNPATIQTGGPDKKKDGE